MPKLISFAKELNELVKEKSNIEAHSISVNPTFNNFKLNPLLEGSFYVFVPDLGLQREIKERIKEFNASNNLKVVVTTRRYCKNQDDTLYHECHGHLADPFDVSERKNIFLDEFPEDINGNSIYFLREENFEKYKKIMDVLNNGYPFITS